MHKYEQWEQSSVLEVVTVELSNVPHTQMTFAHFAQSWINFHSVRSKIEQSKRAA